jgi:hypothetical protein
METANERAAVGLACLPLLAGLMADPELSLQRMPIIAAIIGRAKTAVHVGLAALFGAVAGFACGAWIGGAGWAILALSPAGVAGLLAAALVPASPAPPW